MNKAASFNLNVVVEVVVVEIVVIVEVIQDKYKNLSSEHKSVMWLFSDQKHVFENIY